MKRTVIILFILAISAILFSSCGKYEDGPALSLRTKKARLKGTWDLSELRNDGTLINFKSISVPDFPLSISASLKFIFAKDETGEFKIAVAGMPMGINGTTKWEFTSKKENLKLKVESLDESIMALLREGGADVIIPVDGQEFEIRRLTNKELWLKSIPKSAEDPKIEMKLKKDKK